MKNNMGGLSPNKLCQKTDPKQFNFETTDEIDVLIDFVGQSRALEAIQFGTNIKKDGFNLYAMGPPGIGKRSIVRTVLEQEAARKPVPSDWVYVYNFSDAKKPISIQLPPGSACKLRTDMESLIENLNVSIPLMFESDEFRFQLQQINDEISKNQEKLLKELGADAKKEGLVIIPSQQGFSVFPLDEKGEILTGEHFSKLPSDVRETKEAIIEKYSNRLSEILKEIPRLYKKKRKREKELEKEFSLLAVGHLIEHLKKKYKRFKEIIQYLENVQADIILNVKDFLKRDETQTKWFSGTEKTSLVRYQVNVLVDHTHTQGAPIIFEEHPSYANLICRVEHIAQFGTLLTDFTLIRSGTLHKANGGYLVIDALKLLMQPFSFESLKRALYTHQIKIELPDRLSGIMSTISLEPTPIPLDIKIILIGDRETYYLLCMLDPDFEELFKVAVDFEEKIEYNKENVQIYARLIGTLAQKEKLRPLNREAVAAVIDHSLRLAQDIERLSTHMRSINDLLREADYCANQEDHPIIEQFDVTKAIKNKIHRMDRIRELFYEEINRDIVLIETKGDYVGQINALSTIHIGDFLFGIPSRITARTHYGKGEVIDIQREVKLSGPIHAKGVLILSGFLSGRYAKNAHFSLSASLVFEQTYGMIEGDSASVAELCVLISAIAGIPIKQTLAVTGSINQHGEIQAIGAVNEKIEGFFDICNAKGLTGSQGVLIPSSNVTHLMLREDVVMAAKAKKFHIYPISNIDEAITLLMGVPAGQRNKKGNFPKGSVNELVESRLQSYSRKKTSIHKKIIRKKVTKKSK